MSSITELKDKISCKTLNLVLLSIATAGIYPIMWLYRNHQIISKVTEIKAIDDVFVIWIAVCMGLSGEFISSEEEAAIIIGVILVIAGSILYIVCAFKMRSCLQEYALQKHRIDLPMNRFYTFLFTILYINYCINDLKEVDRKNKILQEKS